MISKRLPKCTGGAISTAVLDILLKFKLSTNQILMFVTDFVLSFATKNIIQCYPDVDTLIANMKAMEGRVILNMKQIKALARRSYAKLLGTR